MSLPPIVIVTISVPAVTDWIWFASTSVVFAPGAGDEGQGGVRALLSDEPRVRVDAAATRARERELPVPTPDEKLSPSAT